MITLSPAYGRDYKSRAAAIADLDADKDFIIETFDNPYFGKPINKTQLIEAGLTSISIRYDKMRKVLVHHVEKECLS